MMNKYTLTVALGLAASAFASGQVNTYDRNFQRLDKIYATKAAKDAKGAYSSMTIAGNVTFPDTQFGYGASFIYTRISAADTGVGTIQSTTSYFHAKPSGGAPVWDAWNETASYQLLANSMGGVTLGVSGASINDGMSTIAPYLAVSYPDLSQWGLQIIPTVSYDHTKGNGATNDGWLPDFMVTYAPTVLPGLIIYGDYTVATIFNGEGSVQAGLAYPIMPQLSAKVAATMAQGMQTGFAAQLGWSF